MYFPDESVSSRINQEEQTLAKMYIVRSRSCRLRASVLRAFQPANSFHPPIPFLSIITKQPLVGPTKRCRNEYTRKNGEELTTLVRGKITFPVKRIINFAEINIIDGNSYANSRTEKHRFRSRYRNRRGPAQPVIYLRLKKKKKKKENRCLFNVRNVAHRDTTFRSSLKKRIVVGRLCYERCRRYRRASDSVQLFPITLASDHRKRVRK